MKWLPDDIANLRQHFQPKASGGENPWLHSLHSVPSFRSQVSPDVLDMASQARVPFLAPWKG